jgi:hypothetical protein
MQEKSEEIHHPPNTLFSVWICILRKVSVLSTASLHSHAFHGSQPLLRTQCRQFLPAAPTAIHAEAFCFPLAAMEAPTLKVFAVPISGTLSPSVLENSACRRSLARQRGTGGHSAKKGC